MWKICFGTALAVLVLPGCAGMGYSTRDRVTTAAREYNDGVRWGKWEQAASHIDKDDRAHFLERHVALEDELEIADYEMIALDIDKSDRKKEKITARLNYTWTLKRQGVVQKTTTLQRWEERDGGWIMAGEQRIHGAPLTLFDEPSRPSRSLAAQARGDGALQVSPPSK
jgi:hypothetical protein